MQISLLYSFLGRCCDGGTIEDVMPNRVLDLIHLHSRGKRVAAAFHLTCYIVAFPNLRSPRRVPALSLHKGQINLTGRLINKFVIPV